MKICARDISASFSNLGYLMQLFLRGAQQEFTLESSNYTAEGITALFTDKNNSVAYHVTITTTPRSSNEVVH